MIRKGHLKNTNEAGENMGTSGTLSGFLGVVILPDKRLMDAAARLTKNEVDHRVAYRVRPRGVHITLYQARDFKELPIEIAVKLVKKLNESLVSNRAGELLLYFLDIRPCVDNDQFLLWNVDRTKENQRLVAAHGMSLALSAWVEPQLVNEARLKSRVTAMPDKRKWRERKLYANARVFGSTHVGEDYQPHITLAAKAEGFGEFKPRQEAQLGSAARVALARIGEWGKIDEILL